jgi:hypothetical protein
MQNPAEVVQRWRVLRTMLTEQLGMFESGALILRAKGVNISEGAIADLKRQIFELNALIDEDEADNL